MKRVFAAIMSVAVMATFTPLASAQSACPPEVAKAKEMLSQKTSAQAPKSLAAARGQDVQAARGQDAQTARGQDIQTARAGSGSKPSGDISKASGLIKQAEAACKAGDMKTAKEKAEAAIPSLK